MQAALVILLLLAAVIIIPRLAGASVGSLVEFLFDKGRAESAQRRRINASYTTALPLPEVFAAASDAAGRFPGAQAVTDGTAGTATVFLGQAGTVTIDVSSRQDGRNRVRVGPARTGVEEEMLARFRGSMLAALRERDPGTRHG
jgi:hypothetical protein